MYVHMSGEERGRRVETRTASMHVIPTHEEMPHASLWCPAKVHYNDHHPQLCPYSFSSFIAVPLHTYCAPA